VACRCGVHARAGETLISHPEIPADRQLVYAFGLFAGLRPGEPGALRWRHYDAAYELLGRLWSRLVPAQRPPAADREHVGRHARDLARAQLARGDLTRRALRGDVDLEHEAIGERAHADADAAEPGRAGEHRLCLRPQAEHALGFPISRVQCQSRAPGPTPSDAAMTEQAHRTLLLVLLAGCSHHPAAPRQTCRTAPPPRCDAATAETPPGETTLRGRVEMGTTLCPGARMTSGCSGAYVIEGELRVTIRGAELGCTGPEDDLCCPVETLHGELVVRGTMGHDERHTWMDVTALCTP